MDDAIIHKLTNEQKERISSIRKKLEEEYWEYKLIRKIYAGDGDVNFDIVGLHKALNTLGSRRYMVLMLHFSEQLSISEIAKYYGADRSRIQQILTQTYRVLKDPKCAELYLLAPISDVNRMKQLEEENEMLRRRNALGPDTQIVDCKTYPSEVKWNSKYRIRIIRTLTRNGILNMGDLQNIKYSDLLKYRGIGPIVADEIAAKMKELGLSFKPE